MTETAAPKAPAFEIPRVNGEPSGFLRIDCIATPRNRETDPCYNSSQSLGETDVPDDGIPFGVYILPEQGEQYFSRRNGDYTD